MGVLAPVGMWMGVGGRVMIRFYPHHIGMMIWEPPPPSLSYIMPRCADHTGTYGVPLSLGKGLSVYLQSIGSCFRKVKILKGSREGLLTGSSEVTLRLRALYWLN